MSNGNSLHIVATGLACPLGIGSAATMAAIHSGIDSFSLLDETSGITTSRLSLLNPDASRSDRMLVLMQYALDDLLANAPPSTWPDTMPLLVALPDADSGDDIENARLAKSFKDQILQQTGTYALLGNNTPTRVGRAGIFSALDKARSLLMETNAPVALVGAIDSLVDQKTVALYQRENALLSVSNMDGRILGEAACFFLVSLKPATPMGNALGRIHSIATGEETRNFNRFRKGEVINTGVGLAEVFSQLSPAFTGRCDLVATGGSIEGYWGREFSYAYLRNESMMPEPLNHHATGFDVGDAGAAAGAVALCYALSELSSPAGSAGHLCRNALVYDVSDSGSMGGLSLFATKQGHH